MIKRFFRYRRRCADGSGKRHDRYWAAAISLMVSSASSRIFLVFT